MAVAVAVDEVTESSKKTYTHEHCGNTLETYMHKFREETEEKVRVCVMRRMGQRIS